MDAIFSAGVNRSKEIRKKEKKETMNLKEKKRIIIKEVIIKYTI